MRASWQRWVLVSVVGVLLAGGIAGLAVALSQSRASFRAQLRRTIHVRASLAAALIDSVVSSSYGGHPQNNAPLTHARVTPDEIRAMTGPTPFSAVAAGNGTVPNVSSALPAAQADAISDDQAIAVALRTNRPRLSNLLGGGSIPPGFIDVVPFQTRFGRRATVSWVPLAMLRSAMDRYLVYVAHYSANAKTANAFLLDSADTVIGASTAAGAVGRPLPNGGLRLALAAGASSGVFGPRPIFYTVAGLRDAPWRVVYTIPSSALYSSPGFAWSVSVLLLGCFAATAAVCLVLLVRLLTSFSLLGRAHAKLEQRNREVEHATEAKSRFVANMSHELRTPLNAVIGFSELMQDGRSGAVSATQREHLGIIRSSANHLLSLINEVLDLAQIEAGRMRLEREVVEPAQIAAECVRSMQPLAADQEVRIDFDPAPIGESRLDPAWLRQVILNYLSNAVKFSDPGGTVTLTLDRGAGELRVQVTDTGPGIAPEDQERVFQEFVQLEGRRRGGTGLGLAVTKLIVEAQGGAVDVHSRPGWGSTFSARLPAPLVNEPDSDHPDPHHPDPHHPGPDHPDPDHPDPDHPDPDHPDPDHPARTLMRHP